MNQRISSIYKKVPATMLLLFLFCMVANTCPIRSLLTGVSSPAAQTEKSTSPINVAQSSKCSVSQVGEVRVWKQSMSNRYSSPNLPVIFCLAGLYLFLSAQHSAIAPKRKKRELRIAEGIPLFLKNQSIII